MKIKIFLRSFFFWLALIMSVIMLALFLPLLSIIYKDKRKLYQAGISLVSKLLLFLAGAKVEMSGLDNIPLNEGVILAANHPGFIDFAVHAAAIPMDFRFVLSYTFYKLPFLKQVVKNAGYIPVGTGPEKRYKVSMLESSGAIVSALKQKQILFIFPEGQRKKNQGEVMAKFRDYPSRIAVAARVPIIPIAVKGSENILPKMKFLLQGEGVVRIRIGKPINFSPDLPALDAANQLQQGIMDLYKTL